MSAQKTVLEENSLFQKSQKTGLEYVLRLDPDRLLAPCRIAAGKRPRAATYGGWESMQIQGHSLGHYMSALSAFVNSTGNAQAKEKLDYVVSELKEIQRADGYIGGVPSVPFDTAFTGNFEVDRFSLAKYWVPWYSVHKIYAGLIDAYTLTQNKDALEIVKKMADWAVNGTANMTEEQFQKMLTCEHGGMCKVFADLYGITKDEKYLKMAERFIHQEIVKPAMKQSDRLQGFHANTQIPKFIGLAKLYELTGKTEYRTAVEFFFDTVTKKRSYAIGGNSIGEHIGPEYQETLGRDTCETCNTYNMLELSEYIFRWNKNADAADYYETALYNHILASQEPVTGAKTYFVSTLPGFYKVYGSFENAFWCCTGTGMENPARYNRFIAKDYDGTIYINLFIPSAITTEDGWKIAIETKFPYEQSAQIKILSEGKSPRSLKIRKPLWTEDARNADGYELKSEKISAGETYSVNLPMNLHTRRTRDRSGNFSILYGPLVLAADMGKRAMPNDTVDNQLVYMNSPAQKISAITADPLTPQGWIEVLDKENLTFATKESAAENGTSYTLKPFYDIHHTRYSVYFNASNPAEDEREAKYESITVDFVEPGRQQSEVEHRFKNEATEMGYIPEVDRSYRKIMSCEGFISYRMKFDNTNKNKIVLTTYGKDAGTIKVYIDDTELSSVTLVGTDGEKLTDTQIEVPAKIIKEKAKSRRTAIMNVKLICEQSQSPRILELRVTK